MGRANLSYFAFTATPKAKTLERFGRRPDPTHPAGKDNLPTATHVYSMRQAIEEGFILDVLKNYTGYKTAWRLAHGGQEYSADEVDQKRAHKSVIRWVKLHDHNIAQRVAIIVEHFREHVAGELGGQAKAMIVADSRLAAVRYKQKIDVYIKQHSYAIGTLVAFSGEVSKDDQGQAIGPHTEANMNKLDGESIPTALDGDGYQVLIVANKYQTGFDQPKLVAMYVDRRLDGVQAVQTLSRLNRVYPGKTQTFVLDFANEPEAVLEAFLPYYGTATLTDVTDPNLLHTLQGKLDTPGIYTDDEIVAVSDAYAAPNVKQAKLQGLLAPAVDRFRERWMAAAPASPERGTLEVFRHDMGTFVRQYEFLSQIISYDDPDLARRAVVFRLLLPLLATERLHDPVDLTGLVLTHHRIRKGAEMDGIPGGVEGGGLDPTMGAGSGSAAPVKTTWEQLLDQLNGLFEGEIQGEHQVDYLHDIGTKLLRDPVLAQQAATNSKENFFQGDFKKVLMKTVIGSLGDHKLMAEQVLTRKDVEEAVASILVDVVYDGFRKQREEKA